MTERTIEIPAPNFEHIEIHIRGLSPGLLCDQYGEETRKLIQEREANPGRKIEKKARNPEAEFQASVYVVAERNGKPARYGFPAAGFKNSIIAAAGRFTGLKNMGPTLGGAIKMSVDMVELSEIDGPYMRTDPRGIKGKRSSLVYRGWFKGWEAYLPMRYDADLFTDQHILNLVARAGEQVGIGNWRPEKKGDFGCWEILGAKG